MNVYKQITFFLNYYLFVLTVMSNDWYFTNMFVLHRAKYGTDSYFPKILGTANSVANDVDFFHFV